MSYIVLSYSYVFIMAGLIPHERTSWDVSKDEPCLSFSMWLMPASPLVGKTHPTSPKCVMLCLQMSINPSNYIVMFTYVHICSPRLLHVQNYTYLKTHVIHCFLFCFMFGSAVCVFTGQSVLKSAQIFPVLSPNYNLVGGLEHFLFSHILEIIIPIDFHIFQRV